MKISVYKILYKTPTGLKSLCTRFDKIDEFIISRDGKIKHFMLFDYVLFNKVCDNFGKIRMDSYNCLL